MVEFLQEIKGEDFIYEKGKKYVSMDDLQEDSSKDKVFIRQPNSPKNKNWWTAFSKSDNLVVFNILKDSDISFAERKEEERMLQL